MQKMSILRNESNKDKIKTSGMTSISIIISEIGKKFPILGSTLIVGGLVKNSFEDLTSNSL